MAIFKNVCIIDDDDLFLILSKLLMEEVDFSEYIHDFEDGRNALDYLKLVMEKDLPEVLFLDINMPMMDGWEVMGELEKLGIVGKIKIYITSSSINPVDLKKAEDSPFISGFVNKPLNPSKLKSIADNYTN